MVIETTVHLTLISTVPPIIEPSPSCSQYRTEHTEGLSRGIFAFISLHHNYIGNCICWVRTPWM